MGIGDWGLGIGDGGWGIGDPAQSPIPNPQSPIPNPQSPFQKKLKIYFIRIRKKNNKLKIIIKILNKNDGGI